VDSVWKDAEIQLGKCLEFGPLIGALLIQLINLFLVHKFSPSAMRFILFGKLQSQQLKRNAIHCTLNSSQAYQSTHITQKNTHGTRTSPYYHEAILKQYFLQLLIHI
jgi:hypothetical protein